MIANRSTLALVALNCISAWPVASGQEVEIPRGRPSITVKFAGGSLADYVKVLQEVSAHHNIILAVPEAKDIRLPAIQLDSVSIGPALALLEGEYRLDDDTVVQVVINTWGGPPGEAANAVSKIRSERHKIKKPPAQVRVWSIGDLILGDRKAEQILTAIETAVGLLKDLPAAQIRYHAETTLVLASGDEEQLRAIDRVVDGIRQTKAKTADQAASAELVNALQHELQKKDRTIEELEQRLKAKPGNTP